MPLLRRFVVKAYWRVLAFLIQLAGYISVRWYMKLYVPYLKRRGMVIKGVPRYIAKTCWFDGEDYGLIELGDHVVISSNVRVLTHDYSLTRAFEAIGVITDRDVANVRPVTIGDNCFVGTGSVLLPGCKLGKNVIVAAGSVVRGDVADDSIVLGSPAVVVGDTKKWAEERLHLLHEGKLKQDPAWWA